MAQGQNPYYVEPANILPGFNLLAQGIKNRGERTLEESKLKKRQAKTQEGMKLLDSDAPPEEVASFMIANPEVGQVVKSAIGFKNEETERRLLETVKRIATREVAPADGAIAHVEGLQAEGADPKHSMELVKTSVQDPEMGIKEAGRIWASLDPKGYTAYHEAMGIGGTEAKDTRTTDIKNYEYEKENNGFKGSLLDFQIAGKDKDNKTTAIKEFEYSVKNPKFALERERKNDLTKIKENKGKSFKNSMDLRKEFLSQSADFQKVRDAYTRVVGSAQDPSPAGDLSLIFNYMKMLDPGSVVRESEFATAAASGSYGQRVEASVQKVLSGERLAPAMRADFVKKSGVLMKGMQSQHKKREKSYGDIADKNNLSRDEVVVDINVAEEQAQNTQVPPPPTIQNFLQKAAAANPGATEQELIDYYNKKYGGL